MTHPSRSYRADEVTARLGAGPAGSSASDERGLEAAELPTDPIRWVPAPVRVGPAPAGDRGSVAADEVADGLGSPGGLDPAGFDRGHPRDLGDEGAWGLFKAALADRVPPVLRSGRVDPAMRGAVALAAVALIAALVAAYFAWRSRPEAVPTSGALAGSSASQLPGGASAGVATVTGRPAATPSPADVVVDVAGKVRRPGVVHLPAGSRVVDALESAGGVPPGVDTSGLSLARRLVDGEQILVTGQPGTPAAAPPAGTSAVGGAASAPPAAPGAPVDLNQATEAQLDALPGVGPVLAQRIVDWRQQHGGFTSTQQLGDVEGVGDKKLADLLPLVTV